MPQPNRRRLVSGAITARIAVDERASNECLRHHGYASEIQKPSNPATSPDLFTQREHRSVHIRYFSLACREPGLQHAGLLCSRGTRSLLHQVPLVPMTFATQFFCGCFAL